MSAITYIQQYALYMVISLCGGLLMADAVSRLLPLRTNPLLKLAPVILFWCTILLPSWIGDENPLIMLPIFLIVFYFSYTGRLFARIVTGMLFYTLILPLNMMIDTAGHWGIMWNFERMHGTVIKCTLYILVWLLVKRLTQEGKKLELSNRLWAVCGLLVISPLIAALSFSIWNSFLRGYTDAAQIRLGYTILPFSMLSAVALLIALTVFSHHEELEHAAQLAQMRELYYAGLQSKQIQVRTLRHDLHNHLTALQGFLEQNDTGKAMNYLAELTSSPALHGTKRICQNEIANVVLTAKREALELQGLSADILVTLPKMLPIADSDLCALLGNALDNAIEAAVNATDKQILVRSRADRGMLMLRVENSFGDKPVGKQGGFATTKPSKETHGFGIRGMREITERYGGTLETNITDSRFELVACLPIKS